jgi:phosphatidylethanolamine/phosphatidyl-N-methylethanolamine N-methyltransferase
MSGNALAHPAAQQAQGGAALFFRRWLRNPLQMGSVIPSSPALCRRLVAHTTWAPGEAVVELGAGTGVVSRALLAAGLPPERLHVVEIVPEMAAHLAATLAGANVITGDAMDLPQLLHQRLHGRIGTVICGIPMVLLGNAAQARLIEAISHVAPGKGFLHFSYCVTSPLSTSRLGLVGRRLAWTPLNIPPASVWHYAPRAGADATSPDERAAG